MRKYKEQNKLQKVSVQFISYAYTVLFTYAAVSKFLDYETFEVQLAQSPLLSAYADVIAWAVPGLEIFIAILLIIPKYRILALYASFTLMIMFTTYIYIILNFSDFIPCSCGGVLEKLSWTQHLIFNIAFIILAGVAILVAGWYSSKKTLFLLAALAIFGVGTVTLLFAFSEQQMHRNNAFQRRYIPHPIEKMHSFDLKYSSYYFAGSGNGKVYLGNSTAPLLMTVVDSSFRDTTTTMIQLDQMELPYRAVKLYVTPPKFYVTDGTVPIILQGATADWKAATKMQGDFYFNHAYPINTHTLAVQSNSSGNGENILGVISFKDSIKGIFNNQLLEKQVDGRFDTDGRLIYNDHLDKLIFTYYYRNEYLIINPHLSLEQRGRTIDTISVAQLHIAENTAKGQRKLGGNTVMVNKNTATSKELLFVDSPRLGKLEPESMINEANIIDAYRFNDKSYEFSFYLYKHENSKAREILISNGMLYALQGNFLVAYKINDRHFE